MPETITLILVFLSFVAFTRGRLMTYLHALQQDDYDNRRFLDWLRANAAFDKRLSLAIFLIWIVSFLIARLHTDFLFLLCFAVAAALERDPRKHSKKKLVMTARAQRIYWLALLLALPFALIGLRESNPWIWIIAVQALPFLLRLANIFLKPVEARIQKQYWDEAHKKLLELRPTVIGITGSFGKTSVKHILGHILKMSAPTLITPGSVNTPMGITRIIREKLDESHKFFVVEMGAYGKGSIERLCALAPPDMAIITAIGQAHYERFKSLDAVAEAKFELAHAALAKGGKIIVNDDVLERPYARNLQGRHSGDFVVCGKLDMDDFRISEIRQSAEGLHVSGRWKGADYALSLPLYGLHHGSNAALAFAAAATLGMAPEHIVTALKSVPQIEHRLEIKRQGDWILIDDAFNSNPSGFRAALETLGMLGADGRKILITPGMAELGAAHDEEHRKIGRHAGEICDVTLVVLPDRIRAFVEGFRETGGAKTLIEVRSFQEASAWLDKNRQSGDVVLIENDLPDIYEGVPRI